MVSRHLKTKVIGFVISLLSTASLAYLWYVTLSFSSGILFVVLLVLLILATFPFLGILVVGYKLVIFRGGYFITLNEIRRRVLKLAKKGKRVTLPPLFIYICGIDGSGKTTQINLISKHLCVRQLRYKYVWLRWAAFISYPFLAFCRLLKYTQWKIIRRSNIKYPEHAFYKNRAIVKVWTWLFSIDIFLYSILRVKIPIKIGYHVLCDRFVLDAVVDLIIETKNIRLLRDLAGRLLLALIPKQSIVIMLDIDEKEAFKRKKDIPSINYLRKRRELYLMLADILKIPIVDGRQNAERVHKEIVERFLSHHPFWYISPKRGSIVNKVT